MNLRLLKFQPLGRGMKLKVTRILFDSAYNFDQKEIWKKFGKMIMEKKLDNVTIHYSFFSRIHVPEYPAVERQREEKSGEDEIEQIVPTVHNHRESKKGAENVVFALCTTDCGVHCHSCTVIL
jgi:hypothetical protein